MFTGDFEGKFETKVMFPMFKRHPYYGFLAFVHFYREKSDIF
jgi:hypothetical protein